MSTVRPTILGLVAIILWGTTIPLSRHAAEQLGTFSSAAAVYLTSGAIGCLYLLASGRTARSPVADASEVPLRLWGIDGDV